MTGSSVPTWLTDAPLHVRGALSEASNLTLLVTADDDPDEALETAARKAVYKPVRGERPLHDFPDGTLAARESTAYLVSEWGGWHLVPPTVLREGPLGPGSVQVWVDTDPGVLDEPAAGLLAVHRPQELTADWLPVVQASDRDGAPLVVAHRDRPDLAGLAVLDVVLNNADRKAAHITLDRGGRVWGFDHGLCGHHRPKLRTVLWGWACDPLPQVEVERLRRLQAHLEGEGEQTLAGLLTPGEVSALGERVQDLLADPVFPDVPQTRSALPWPLW